MKRIRRIVLTISLLAVGMLPAAAAVPDSIDVKAVEQHDSMQIQITAYKIETQLTFLMQGLNVVIEQPDTIKFGFPSAPMVRSKVKRHPNEVKAVLESQRNRHGAGHDSINHVVRPDVLPLVAALNDTTATISRQDSTETTRGFKIDVDRETAVMVFSFKLPVSYVDAKDATLNLYVCSVPIGENRQEFTGKRLSGENSPRPNGLGEGFRKEDAASRTVRKSLSVTIDKEEEQQKTH